MLLSSMMASAFFLPRLVRTVPCTLLLAKKCMTVYCGTNIKRLAIDDAAAAWTNGRRAQKGKAGGRRARIGCMGRPPAAAFLLYPTKFSSRVSTYRQGRPMPHLCVIPRHAGSALIDNTCPNCSKRYLLKWTHHFLMSQKALWTNQQAPVEF